MKKGIVKIIVITLSLGLVFGTVAMAVNPDIGSSKMNIRRLIDAIIGTQTDATPSDATATDATFTDATATDATSTDATSTDATPTDATPTDATETDGSHEHVWDDGTVALEPTCTQNGIMLLKCTVCGEEKEVVIEATNEHTWQFDSVLSEPTCNMDGKTKYVCSVCAQEDIRTTEKTAHKWDKGEITKEPTFFEMGEKTYTCTVCKNVMTAAVSVKTDHTKGETFEFGSYPQATVTDAELTEKLNAELENAEWISFGFYCGDEKADGSMCPDDHMKYVDVTLDGAKYRAVKIDDYRPYSTALPAGANNSKQPANGFETNTVYWYSFEPLVWKVLDPKSMLVICESVIDAQCFNNIIYYDETGKNAYISVNSDTYTNNYAESSIRNWLNEDFAKTAFTDSEFSKIALTALDNSAYNSNYSQYNAPETNDKVFLLSYKDTKNTKLFSSNADTAAKATGYSLCMGAESDIPYATSWMLRSPGINSYTMAIAKYTGKDDKAYVNYTYISSIGIRPACCLTPKSLMPEIKFGDLDNDGKVTSSDARLALRASVGIDILFGNSAVAADVDHDGKVTSSDARLILRASVGLEEI